MSLLFRVKEFLKARLSEDRRRALRARLAPLLARFYARDLKALAVLFGSDKWNDHWYASRYQWHFQGLRHRRMKILEIGIGGYDDPNAGGASLRMWKYFFPKSQIFGLDLHEKHGVAQKRIQVLQADQGDSAALRAIAEQHGPFDIIIDDGSHRNDHVILTFECLFPALKDSGFYAVEDTQTSYWPEFGGHKDRSAPDTMMNHFKARIDGLNHEDFRDDSYEASDWDRSIAALHFYHNLIVIEKGQPL